MELTPINGEAVFAIGPFYKASGQDTDWNGTLEYARNSVALGINSLSAITCQSTELPRPDVVLDLAGKAANAPVISPVVKPMGDAKPTITDGTLNQIRQAMQDNTGKDTANSSGLKILQVSLERMVPGRM